MDIEILRLNLLSPLYFIPQTDADPFGYREENGEMIFYFELDEGQYQNIEPDKDKLLGNPVFGGKSAGDLPEGGEGLRELPQGNYLFAQKREILSSREIIDIAVEIQQEGLWQRLQMGKGLYLRYLFEDGQGVTQLFRPCKASS